MASAARQRVPYDTDENSGPQNGDKLATKPKTLSNHADDNPPVAQSRSRGRVTDALVTQGTVERIILGETNFKPVLQVLSIKRKGDVGLTLGDGDRCVDAALAPNVAYIVNDGHVKELSLVTLKAFFCTTVDHKAVLVVMDLEVSGIAPGIVSVSTDRLCLSSAPSGAPKSTEESSKDLDEEIPQRLGRGRSFGHGSRDWFDAPPTLPNSSLSRDIAKALVDGVDIETILPDLLAGKGYVNSNTGGQTWNGDWKQDDTGPTPDKQRVQRAMSRDIVSRNGLSTTPKYQDDTGPTPDKLRMQRAVSRDTVSRNAYNSSRKNQVEREDPPCQDNSEAEPKKRSLLSRLLGKKDKKKDEAPSTLNHSRSSNDVRPKAIARATSSGGNMKKSKLKKATSSLTRSKSKSKITANRKVIPLSHSNNDDDEVAPPPEDEYRGRK